MLRRSAVRTVLSLSAASVAVVAAAGSAGAGVAKTGPLTYDPNPVEAGSSTVVSGECPVDASFVTVSFDLELADGSTAAVSVDIDIDPVPETGAFSSTIAIPATAIAQTVPTLGECIATFDGEFLIGSLEGDLSVTTPPPPTTTTVATTAATTAPSTTAGPVTLPNTGSNGTNAPAALIGAGALAIGVGLIVLARRRSAET